MKKFCLYFLIAAGLIAASDVNAKIWRVNNNTGKSADFTGPTALTAALNSANVKAGDTIHIEGSVTPYGKDPQTATNCDTIRKKLVLIGPGYQLSDNSETQHNKESAKIRTIHIASSAAGTIIAGLEQVTPTTANHYNANGVQAGYYAYTSGINTYGGWADAPADYKLRIAADSVVVTHCKLFFVDIFNKDKALTNITITKCMFNPGLIACAAGDNQVTNLIISNNFFKNYWDWGVTYWYQIVSSNAVLDFRGKSGYYNTTNTPNAIWDVASFPVISPTIQNNTFYSSFSIIAKGCQLYNNLFFPKQAGQYYNFGLYQYADRPHVTRNNIIYNFVYWKTPSPGGLFYNDNNYGGMLPGVDGNQYSNRGELEWFTGSLNSPLNDKSFLLANNSPAGDNSDDTRQKGMFGGLSPYVLSGLYTIPAVWEITIPNYPTGEVPSTGFEVRVRVKSH